MATRDEIKLEEGDKLATMQVKAGLHMPAHALSQFIFSLGLEVYWERTLPRSMLAWSSCYMF